jgi:hypothetical protein
MWQLRGPFYTGLYESIPYADDGKCTDITRYGQGVEVKDQALRSMSADDGAKKRFLVDDFVIFAATATRSGRDASHTN